jgi:hypothetical protein
MYITSVGFKNIEGIDKLYIDDNYDVPFLVK